MKTIKELYESVVNEAKQTVDIIKAGPYYLLIRTDNDKQIGREKSLDDAKKAIKKNGLEVGEIQESKIDED